MVLLRYMAETLPSPAQRIQLACGTIYGQWVAARAKPKGAWGFDTRFVGSRHVGRGEGQGEGRVGLRDAVYMVPGRVSDT